MSEEETILDRALSDFKQAQEAEEGKKQTWLSVHGAMMGIAGTKTLVKQMADFTAITWLDLGRNLLRDSTPRSSWMSSLPSPFIVCHRSSVALTLPHSLTTLHMVDNKLEDAGSITIVSAL